MYFSGRLGLKCRPPCRHDRHLTDLRPILVGVREGDKLEVVRFPLVICSNFNPNIGSVTSADVNTVFSGFAVHLHSRSLPVETAARSEQQTLHKKKTGQRTSGHPNAVFWIGIASPIIFSWSVKATYLRVVQKPWSFAYLNSVVLFGGTYTVFAVNVNDSILQVHCKVRPTLGSQEIDPALSPWVSVKATNLKSYGFLVMRFRI